MASFHLFPPPKSDIQVDAEVERREINGSENERELLRGRWGGCRDRGHRMRSRPGKRKKRRRYRCNGIAGDAASSPLVCAQGVVDAAAIRATK